MLVYTCKMIICANYNNTKGGMYGSSPMSKQSHHQTVKNVLKVV